MIVAYHERWPEMLRGEMVGTLEVLKELKTLGLRRNTRTKSPDSL